MRKSITTLALALATLSFGALASTSSTQLPSANDHYNDQLCYIKQQSSPVHYTSQASLYGYSRQHE